MGQDSSSPIDESVAPETLSDRSISAVAEYIREGKAKRIAVLTGAGISTAAGIPDFRSPGTGLYANLARLNLPYAEAVFDISYFREHPEPFYVLARELYPGKFYPTISHAFIALLAQKDVLHLLFTQNIDCLERRAGVPSDKVIEAHGSFATQRCIDCKEEYPDDQMLEHVHAGTVPRCEDKSCGGLVKPDIVFFGEALPLEFREKQHEMYKADLVLVIGTSLSVHPFASLPELTTKGTPRMLFNLERVGEMGTRADDVLVLEDCDSGIRKLADELGWRAELEELWKGIVGDKEAKRQKESRRKHQETMEDEVNKLTAEVESALKIEESAPEKAVEKTQEPETKTEESTQARQSPISDDSSIVPEKKEETTPIVDATEPKSLEDSKEKEAQKAKDAEKSVL